MASVNERLTYIENLLLNGKYSSTQIMERVINSCYDGIPDGVSTRTIQRDLKKISSYGVEIKKQGDFYFIDNKDSLYFNESESAKHLNYLSILAEIAKMDTAQNMFNINDEELNEKLHKKKNNKSSRKIIHWDENPEYSNVKLLPKLYKAILDMRVLKIIYHSFTKEPTEYIFHPYLLKEHENRWFVCGLNTQDSSRQYNLPLDRIMGIEELPSVKYIAQKEEWEDYYFDVVGTTVFANIEVQEISFFIKSPRCKYVQTKPIHHSQKIKADDSKEGGSVFRIKVKPNRELTAKLYSFGADLELLSPFKSVPEIDEYINSRTIDMK